MRRRKVAAKLASTCSIAGTATMTDEVTSASKAAAAPAEATPNANADDAARIVIATSLRTCKRWKIAWRIKCGSSTSSLALSKMLDMSGPCTQTSMFVVFFNAFGSIRFIIAFNCFIGPHS